METLRKIAKKMSHKAEKNLHKKFLGQGRDSNPSAWQTSKKAVSSMPSASRSSVAQFSVSASQLIKLIKSVSSLVFKKKEKEVTAIVCVFVFYEKRRLKTNFAGPERNSETHENSSEDCT